MLAELKLEKFESQAGYLSGISFQSFLEYLENHHPLLRNLIDDAYVHDLSFDGFATALNAASWEFEGVEAGRGGSYNLAQHRYIDNRKDGMSRLLTEAVQNGPRIAGRPFVLLDALAGDGTIQRYAAGHDNHDLYIISADLSAYMVECCRQQNFPCLRQAATCSLLRDNVLDGVLLAYGTHHIPREQRALAVREAYRTLAPGGRLVLHDFAVGSAMDSWFADVVHPYTRTGHDHPHFLAEELQEYFENAGFTGIEIASINDPFETAGDTAHAARHHLIEFMHGMYGLELLPLRSDAEFAWLETHIERIFGPIELSFKEEIWTARVCREAIVATATK
jgi:SAM-dependent methyltransferase